MLPEIIKHLLSNDRDRLFLADAIAGAEGRASKHEEKHEFDEDYAPEMSWDEILKSALSELAETPLG